MGLFTDPYEWAYRAHDTFVSALSDEFRGHFVHDLRRGEARVVVYGESQVGKTSLILDLMGVSEDQFHRVSGVLRGTRTSGESATASAMQYRRSMDGGWRVFRSGQSDSMPLDDEAAASALASIRDEMEAGVLDPGEVNVVAIPADCFQDGGGLPVAMLDLPGANAANERERTHVHEVASRYVSTADLVLLVGRGDWLSFLKPDRLQVPGIEDWQLMPWRFRVVFTHAYTLDSIQNALRRHSGPLSVAALRRMFVEQVATFNHIQGDISPMVYPLEFGDSWLAAGGGTDNVKALVAPLNEALKEELKSDIAMACADHARLRSALNAHHAAERVGERRIEECERALHTTGMKRSRAESKLEAVEAGLVVAVQELEKCKAGGFGSLSKKTLVKRLIEGARLEVAWDCKKRPLERLQDWRYALTRAAQEWRPKSFSAEEYRAFWRPVFRISDLTSSVDSLMDSRIDELYRIASPGLFKQLITREATREERLRAQCLKLQGEVDGLVQETWASECAKRVERRMVEVDRAVQAVHGGQNALKLRKQEVARLSKELKTLEDGLVALHARVGRDRRIARQFHKFLSKEYARARRSSLRRCGTVESPFSAFAELIHLVRIGRARGAIGAEW